MEVATLSSTSVLPRRMLASPAVCLTTNTKRTKVSASSSSCAKCSLSSNFLSPFLGGSVCGEFSGHKIRPASLNRPLISRSKGKRGVLMTVSASSNPTSSASVKSSLSASFGGAGFSGQKVPLLNPASISGSEGKRSVVAMVIPFVRGSAWEQPPPDLASYLFKNRIVYLGMCLVPAVTELLVAEFMWLEYDDNVKPIYFYINSTGSIKNGEKVGFETEAFTIYDIMSFLHSPIFTLAVGNAWGEAALLLAAGSKGNRSALPSSTMMIKQPIGRFQGQASDVDIYRNEIKRVKATMVRLYAMEIGRTEEEIEADIRRPKYFSPSEAVEYGIIDKVYLNQRDSKGGGVFADLKRL